jgi:hypothetical protein
MRPAHSRLFSYCVFDSSCFSRALEAAGVIFIEENGDGAGVRLRKEGTDDRFAVALQIAGCLVFVWWLHAAAVEDAQVSHEVSRFQQSFTRQLQTLSNQLAIIDAMDKAAIKGPKNESPCKVLARP